MESVPKNDYILNRMNRAVGKNLLIIEDDKDIAELLRVNLGGDFVLERLKQKYQGITK